MSMYEILVKLSRICHEVSIYHTSIWCLFALLSPGAIKRLLIDINTQMIIETKCYGEKAERAN